MDEKLTEAALRRLIISSQALMKHIDRGVPCALCNVAPGMQSSREVGRFPRYVFL